MSNRARIIVSLMFVVVIILAAAVTQFYMGSSDDSTGDSSHDEIIRRLDTNSAGFTLFTDEQGNYGIAEDDKITASPEWLSLSVTEGSRFIARKKTGGSVKTGCIDHEGNVVVPLVYGSIEKITAGDIVLYRAISQKDGSVVVYDTEFYPVFNQPWISCSVENDEFVFTDESGEYRYSAGNGKFLFKSASVGNEIMECPWQINVYSRVLLSKLTPLMIETMTEKAADYIEYAFTGDEEIFKQLSFGGIREFKQVFPDCSEIVRKKPVSIKEIHLYSTSTEDGVPRYEVSADVEIEITYKDKKNVLRLHKGIYKAAVLFSAGSEGSIKALSGHFESDVPDYPVDETDKDENDDPEQEQETTPAPEPETEEIPVPVEEETEEIL